MSSLDRVLLPRQGAEAALQTLIDQRDRLSVQRLSVSDDADALAQVLGAARRKHYLNS